MSGVLRVRGLASERKVRDRREEEHVVWSHGGLEGELRVSCHVYPPFDTNLLFGFASTSLSSLVLEFVGSQLGAGSCCCVKSSLKSWTQYPLK